MRPYISRYYDPYFTGVEGDVDFYVAQACGRGPVLELGCGTGRVTLPLARAGVEVVGMDHDGELLALARDKSAREQLGDVVEWLEGDMGDFALGRRFEQIFIPYRTFQHLLTPYDQIRALECMADHLVEGGALVFDTFDPAGEFAQRGFSSPLGKDTDFLDPTSGNQVVVWYGRQADPEDQILEQELIFEELDAGGAMVARTYGRLSLRWTTRWEMEHLLAGCGFEVETLGGDFAGGGYPGFGNQVWVARKVAGAP